MNFTFLYKTTISVMQGMYFLAIRGLAMVCIEFIFVPTSFIELPLGMLFWAWIVLWVASL